MDIEFDTAKAQSNLKKHGVRFEEAASCLFDAMALAREDSDAEGEARWVLLGMSSAGRLLAVVYTLRGDTPRLISARRATKKEEQDYYA
jgi:uncharacterized DUF497 family protein